VEQATIDGAVQRLRPKLMTVTVISVSPPYLGISTVDDEADRGSDRRRMITSTIHVLILVPAFLLIKRRRYGGVCWLNLPRSRQ
jgi:Cu(I)/Ag(I) efflux system membrane protein CusA/SilA